MSDTDETRLRAWAARLAPSSTPGSPGAAMAWAVGEIDRLRRDAKAADAARRTAPPVDVAAQLGAAADAGDAAATHDYGTHTVRDALREAAAFLTVWPESPVAQAIARALTATPTEETRTDAR